MPLSIAGGLGIALMLNRRVRFVGLYRTLVFVPYIMSATAQGVLFSFVFDSQFGVANSVLHHVGIGSQGFLQDPGQALWVLVLIGLWSGIGFSVVVYLAALQDIPPELVEAASIDGARRWGVLRHVVLPALNPVTIFLIVWQTFESLQLFDLVFVTTRGGPLQSTTVVVLYVWQQAFQFFNAGYGAAAAYVLAFGLLVVALAWGWYQRRRQARLGMRINRWHFVLAPMALIFALPLLWLTVSSFMTNAQINRFPPHDHPRRAAPRRLPLRVPDRRLRPLVPELDDRGRGHGACRTSCSARSPATRSRACASAARGSLLALMLATLVVPFQLTMIPTFLLMKKLGLIDSLGALILPSLVTPFGVFLLRQFFVSVPREIEEAAWIDGCSRLSTLVQIVLPLARPALATVAVLTFLTVWNDLTWPLIAINSSEHYTLQLGLATYSGAHRTQWAAVMAGNLLVTLPVVIAFLLAQRTFIRSLTSSAVKG